MSGREYAHDIDRELIERVRTEIADERTANLLAETFKALADGTRIRLISALTGRELCVGELAAVLGMSISAVSHQLGSLRTMRLVKSRRSGRHIYYALDDEHVTELYGLCLEHVTHGIS